MAFDHDGFFAIVGKYVKLIDQADGYIDAIESRKDEIQTIYGTEGILDTYITVPPLIDGIQQNITGWIQALVNDLENLITNRPYVIEQLQNEAFDVRSILHSLYDYMVTNGETIESSVVSLGGSDANEKASTNASGSNGELYPRLYVSRILDGVNSPGNGAEAQAHYVGIEGQLARSTTIYAKLTSNAAGSETCLLFSEATETPPYVLEDEEPGTGPTLTTAEGQNLISNNPKFDSWTGNVPNGWQSDGVATTDFADSSGTGLGPLQILTTNKIFYQQVSGLQRNRMYFAAVTFHADTVGTPGNTVVALEVRNLSDTTSYMSSRTSTVIPAGSPDLNLGTAVYGQAFGFFYLPDSANVDDVYVEIKATTIPADGSIKIRKVVICPAVYYNGLACAWWAPYGRTGSVTFYDFTALGVIASLAIANNDNGVFQRFFRKAYNLQLPTADSPTIADTLAT